jgi:amino acid permease
MAPGKSIKPFDGFNTLINVLMGTGPILLPPVVASAGIGLSVILLLILALISIIGAEFIIESLGVANCLK